MNSEDLLLPSVSDGVQILPILPSLIQQALVQILLIINVICFSDEMLKFYRLCPRFVPYVINMICITLLKQAALTIVCFSSFYIFIFETVFCMCSFFSFAVKFEKKNKT